MKPSSILLFLVIMIGTLVLISCTDKSNPSTPDTNSNGDLRPLAVGNYWVYRESDNNAQITQYDSIVITTTVTIQGASYFQEETFIHAPDSVHWWHSPFKHYLTVRDDGYYQFDSSNMMPKKFLPSQPSAGYHEVIIDTTGGQFLTDTIDCRSISDNSTVPAGTFTNCTHIRNGYSSGSVYDTWYKPGVGEVRFLYSLPSAPQYNYSKALLRYRVN